MSSWSRFQSTCPARGTTHPSNLQIYRARHFNPRAPRGARRLYLVGLLNALPISIHVPREGHDLCLYLVGLLNALPISIHVPREGHDSPALIIHQQPPISIHVPREGHDGGNNTFRRAHTYFNPRAPRGARQDLIGTLDALGWISIHVPREGHDLSLQKFCPSFTYFNPRAPRGARLAYFC